MASTASSSSTRPAGGDNAGPPCSSSSSSSSPSTARASLPSTDQSKRGPPVGPKLRATCNACSRAKVRCSKEHPTCSRCARLEWPCEYGVSNRSGRPAFKLPSTIDNTPQRRKQMSMSSSSDLFDFSTPPTIDTTFDLLLGPTPHCSSGVNYDSGFSPISLDGGWPWWDLSSTQDVTSMGAGSAGGNLDFIDSLAYDDIIMTDDLPVEQLKVSAPSACKGPEVSTSPKATSSQPSRRTSSSDAEPCLTSILSIVGSLFPCSARHCRHTSQDDSHGSSGESPRTLLNVIEQNRDILSVADRVLDCSCSTNEYILRMLNLVLLKILAWYAAAARGCRDDQGGELPFDGGPRPSMASSHDNSEARTTGSLFAEEVDHAAGTEVGGYKIDSGDGGKSASRLVLGELHRVQLLVKKVHQRTAEIPLEMDNDSEESMTVNEDGLRDPSLWTAGNATPNLHHQADELRRRLKYITRSVVGKLRQ